MLQLDNSLHRSRLPEAIEDHDNIIAVIRGTFVNNDGNRKAGFAAPGVFGQQECLESALTIAETTADELDYVETHGTATVLGDSVELRALKNVIGKREAGNEVMIGSVKSNIGHTNIAAGIANLIKGALMLQHRILVPSIHYRKPNTESTKLFCVSAIGKFSENTKPCTYAFRF